MLSQVNVLLVVTAVCLIVLGVAVVDVGIEVKSTPQRLTCAELSADGPGDNAYVRLTDAVLCSNDFVYAKDGDEWQAAWVPAVPPGSEYLDLLVDRGLYGVPGPVLFRVLVKMPTARRVEDVERAGMREELVGIVQRASEGLSAKEREFLEEIYPTLKLENCWVLELDRHPASPVKLIALFGGGALLLALVGVLTLLQARRQASASSARET